MSPLNILIALHPHFTLPAVLKTFLRNISSVFCLLQSTYSIYYLPFVVFGYHCCLTATSRIWVALNNFSFDFSACGCPSASKCGTCWPGSSSPAITGSTCPINDWREWTRALLKRDNLICEHFACTTANVLSSYIDIYWLSKNQHINTTKQYTYRRKTTFGVKLYNFTKHYQSKWTKLLKTAWLAQKRTDLRHSAISLVYVHYFSCKGQWFKVPHGSPTYISLAAIYGLTVITKILVAGWKHASCLCYSMCARCFLRFLGPKLELPRSSAYSTCGVYAYTLTRIEMSLKPRTQYWSRPTHRLHVAVCDTAIVCCDSNVF